MERNCIDESEGYVEASVVSMVFIWAHGAAHGAWKYSTSRELGDADDVMLLNASSEVTSCSDAMLVAV